MSADTETEEGIRFQVRENRTALLCGALAVAFAIFILIMRLLHPSDRGGGALLYLPLLCMLLFGVGCFVLYCNRKLIVAEMELCYVNLFGKRKNFTLDEIGFCKIGAGGNRNAVVLYDLRGDKLCKLDFDMCGIAQLHQYLLDNRIEVEWPKERLNGETAYLLDTLQKETSVCGEEIHKCSEEFYEKAETVFRDWEKNNSRYEVHWEVGFAQYLAEDLEGKCRLRERVSSVSEPLEVIPDSYECLLEAYLKQGDEYIVNRQGEELSIAIPYLSNSKSYQIGEKLRIRKTDEQSMTDWLEIRLEALAAELPRHKYHTEAFTLRHKLSQTAGIVSQKDIRYTENVVR